AEWQNCPLPQLTCSRACPAYIGAPFCPLTTLPESKKTTCLAALASHSPSSGAQPDEPATSSAPSAAVMIGEPGARRMPLPRERRTRPRQARGGEGSALPAPHAAGRKIGRA